jgi:phospholipase C
MVHEMNQGAMDGFVTAPGCGHPNNVALADASTVGTYWTWAGQGALADRYFQPVAGATSANDMYFARAGYLFTDNAYFPDALGKTCQRGQVHSFEERTIVDLLRPQGVTMGIFAEGYKAMQNAVALGTCPKGHRDCPAASDDYPCTYDASDIPFAYFRRFADDPSLFHDLSTLDEAIDKGTLPAVTFVKQLGFRTEHPGAATTIQDGAQGVDRWVSRLLAGPQGASTLVLVTFDESGGYFDHVAPPPPNPADGMPYGPRVPMLALGPFARKGHVSHEILEHSSIVKFIEWNWLGGTTGQLGTRDGFVANLGSLLEDRATGIPVPQGR